MTAAKLVCVDDFEKEAFKILAPAALGYYKSGANEEVTLNNNITAFKRWQIRPRFLRDVSKRDISTTVQGCHIDFPVCISPTAMQRMAHPDGEIATAKAAAGMNIVFTLSTIATSSIEEVARGQGPNGARWFQLYIYKDRDITKQLVRRAEKAGFKALALTIDTPMFGKRLIDTRNRFKLPPHLKMANFEALDRKGFRMNVSKKGSGLNEYANELFDPSLTWDDVKWLKSFTHLPVIVKGVLTGEDALKALECKVDGIWVSNHGARQLDGVPATIDVLPEVAKAVDGKCEIYLDSGIRTGTDILKALALGATAVFIGRPALYGLACQGEEGVRMVLQILKDEFDQAMALSGCRSIKELSPDLLRHQSTYSKL
ncbi:2-Hydroxyacid oxidase 1-like [Tubulanus polymorphus]|uniref:2-Hydroxyacid oxidase 1-like n=1 Tax=Tubulanus polymorphus TaxID=672921 RepID=UPI003DA4061C